MITPALLLLTVVAVLVDCRPQDNFTFPGQAARSPRLPLNPPSRPTTTGQVNDGPESTSASTTSDEATTRIPPPDPSYRMVFTLPKNCACLFTPQYDPVCGTDGRTYGNFGIMDCNKRCGVAVEVYLMGACGLNNG